VHNFTDVRMQMDVTVNSLAMDSPNMLNNTIDFLDETKYQLGNNVLFNDTETREFHFIINGKQPVAGEITDKRTMKVVAHRCIGSDCFDTVVTEETCSETIRKWSVNKDWCRAEDQSTCQSTGNAVPAAGESFVIPTGWNMQLDIAETPEFDKIEINGCLHFKPGMDVHLKAKKILIRGGEFYIG
jgi:hypothetical protein